MYSLIFVLHLLILSANNRWSSCSPVSFKNQIIVMESVTYIDIAELKDVQKGVQFCRKFGLLPSEDIKDCDGCDKQGSVVTAAFPSKVNYPYFHRCKSCHKRSHITSNTWFEGCRFTIGQNIWLIYCWLHGLSIEKTCGEVNLSSKTVGDYFGFCRELIFVILTNLSEPIGGEGKTVEVEEFHMTIRKFYRSRVLRNEMKQIWVFGGIERGTNRFFLLQVLSKDRETMMNLIKRFILPETLVVSDGWKVYSELQQEGYDQALSDHSIKFLGTEESTEERLWELLKRSVKKKGRPGLQDETYIFQQMYFQSLKLRGIIHPKNQLPIFLRDIAKVYAGFGKSNMLPKAFIGSELREWEDE